MISYHTPDLNIPWKNRPFHWSQMSSWEYDPEQWYQTYFLGKKFKPNRELIFGKMIDDKIQDDPTFIPELVRYPILQHEMAVMYGKVRLHGTADAFHREELRLRDYKTGKVAWTQKRADETGQLTMYLLLLYISEKIKPETMTCYIDWLPTIDTGEFVIKFRDNPVKPIVFETKRTMRDLLDFGAKINKTIEDMERYAKAHK